MLEEDAALARGGQGDFTKSVDWGISVPIGILYIAANLRAHGHEVRILDLHRAFKQCRDNGYFATHTLPSFFEEFFDETVRDMLPDILGLSCLFNVSSSTALHLAQRCQQFFPSVAVVMGGHYPTSEYPALVRDGSANYILLGEAEESFALLCDHFTDPDRDALLAASPGIVQAKALSAYDHRAVVVQDLDALPMPDLDMLPHRDEYLLASLHAERVGVALAGKTIKAAPLFTTRGCPMHCTFCASFAVHGRKVRAHSIDYLMRCINVLVARYGVNHLLIEDDMFNYSISRSCAFCDAVYKRYGNHFTIEFPNGFAIWNLNNELAAKLKKIGLSSVTVGVESGSPYVQKHILKKNLNLTRVRENIRLFQAHGIGVRAFFIVGFVGETLKMMEETVQFALSLNIDWAEVKIFTPLVGSEMYACAHDKGYLIGDMSEHVYGRCCVKTPEFSPEEVKQVQYDANIRINFLNNLFLREKRFMEAEKVFKGLLARFPGHVFAQWGLEQALAGQGKEKQAQEAHDDMLGMADRSTLVAELLKKYGILRSD
ncbi:MAG: B12-binding domain-containing radical SAM protein [Kiritimatiellae bacterium]|nr:B12-binding domain-containing radical SAM protein [Kiritimatiellia bacterium]